MTTTYGTYPWSSVTGIFRIGLPSNNIDIYIFVVKTSFSGFFISSNL